MSDVGVSPILRNLQTRFSGVNPLKLGLYNAMTKYFGWHIEPDFDLLPRLGAFDLAIDIGANWGQSILALKARGRPRRIMSFEPNPILAARLKAAYAHDPRVTIEACGLGDQDDQLNLFVPRYRNFVYDGLASLDEHEARDWLPGRMAWFDPDKLFIDEYQVPVRTLDSYGLEPDVVKIDVQGFEMKVVQGGLGTLRRRRPVTIVEWPSAELTALFKTLDMDGYRWTGKHLVPGDHAGPIKGYNTVFLHPDRLAQMDLTGVVRTH